MLAALAVIILGSATDEPALYDSGMLDILDKCGVMHRTSVASAHRNADELERYCTECYGEGARLFCGVGGMALALPGVIASYFLAEPDPPVVLGVPLPSTNFPDGRDAQISIEQLPPDIAVPCFGAGKSGLINAAITIATIFGLTNESVGNQLYLYRKDSLGKKPVKLDIDTVAGREAHKAAKAASANK